MPHPSFLDASHTWQLGPENEIHSHRGSQSKEGLGELVSYSRLSLPRVRWGCSNATGSCCSMSLRPSEPFHPLLNSGCPNTHYLLPSVLLRLLGLLD